MGLVLSSLSLVCAKALVVLLQGLKKGACKAACTVRRHGKGCLGLQREEGALVVLFLSGNRGSEQKFTLGNIGLECVGVEGFHFGCRQNGNAHLLGLLFFLL